MWPGIPDTYQKLPESDSGSFRYTRSRDYQTPTRHALLGSGSCWKTYLIARRSPDFLSDPRQILYIIEKYSHWLNDIVLVFLCCIALRDDGAYCVAAEHENYLEYLSLSPSPILGGILMKSP